jgi:Family of unknown function (DUF5343)
MAEAYQEETGRGIMPPYAPFPSLKNFVQNAKQQGLANRIDRSVLTNFSGSAQTQLITSFRFLGLIDSKGHPTDRMVALVGAGETEQWSVALATLLRAAYPLLFEGFDLATASPNQFNERFRNAFPGADSVQRKAVTFFLAAAQDAKIPVSPHITKNKKPRAVSSSSRRRGRTATTRVSAEPVRTDPAGTAVNGAWAANPKAPNAYELLAVFDPSDMSPDEQAAVWTLIQYLKRKEVGAPAVGRQRRDASRSRPAAAPIPEAKEAPDGTTLTE